MNDLDSSMHRSLWVSVAHSSFIEGSHTTKTTASGKVGAYPRGEPLRQVPSLTIKEYSRLERPPRNSTLFGPFMSYERYGKVVYLELS